MIYSPKYIKRRYIVRIFSTLFYYDVTSIAIILICIVITLVIFQKYIITLFHDGDVIYDINIFIKLLYIYTSWLYIFLNV